MPESTEMRKGRGVGTLVADLRLRARSAGSWSRADLVFLGVDHSSDSYEVRAFMNVPSATVDAPRDPALGYAGRFVIFGHGGCFGDTGHCELPVGPRNIDDLRPPHQLVPVDKIITVTRSLRQALANGGLETVTLVPYLLAPRRKDRRATRDQFRFESLDLRTYLSDTEADALAEEGLSNASAALHGVTAPSR